MKLTAGYKDGGSPVTKRVASQGLSLPMNAYLTEAETERVCGVVV